MSLTDDDDSTDGASSYEYFAFLELPLELREEVYKHVFNGTMRQRRIDYWENSYEPLNTLLVSRGIYHEALRSFYRYWVYGLTWPPPCRPTRLPEEKVAYSRRFQYLSLKIDIAKYQQLQWLRLFDPSPDQDNDTETLVGPFLRQTVGIDSIITSPIMATSHVPRKRASLSIVFDFDNELNDGTHWIRQALPQLAQLPEDLKNLWNTIRISLHCWDVLCDPRVQDDEVLAAREPGITEKCERVLNEIRCLMEKELGHPLVIPYRDGLTMYGKTLEFRSPWIQGEAERVEEEGIAQPNATSQIRTWDVSSFEQGSQKDAAPPLRRSKDEDSGEGWTLATALWQ